MCLIWVEKIKNNTMLHETIKTKHVFSDENQVFLKATEETTINNEEWYPINFQWIPIIELQNNLKL